MEDAQLVAKGCVHHPVGHSKCSQRIKGVESLFLNGMSNINNIRFRRKRIFRKKQKKDRRLDKLQTSVTKTYLSVDDVAKNHYYFFNYDDDPMLELIKNSSMDNKKPIKLVRVNHEDLNIVDTYSGAKLIEKVTNIPIFILVPRNDSIKAKANACLDAKTLNNVLVNHKVNTIRGTDRKAVATHYGTFGTHANRNSGGNHVKIVKDKNLNDELHLKKMLNRIVHYAKQFLPFGMLSILKNAKSMTGDKNTYASIPKLHLQYSTIWSSMASTFNYMCPAHTDEDSFLSALLVTHVPQEKENNRYMNYETIAEVAVYFCYPTLGIAIALRPGDILFFNPLHYHCCSQRESHYKNDKLYLTSFYLKNKQMNGNDNNVEVNETIEFEVDLLKTYMPYHK